MGLLTNLINERQQKQREERQNKVAAYKTLLTDPNAEPQQKEWALQQMLGEAGTPKGAHEPIVKIIGHLMGFGNKQPQGQGQAQAQDQSQGPTQTQAQTQPQRQPFFMSEQEQLDRARKEAEAQTDIDVNRQAREQQVTDTQKRADQIIRGNRARLRIQAGEDPEQVYAEEGITGYRPRSFTPKVIAKSMSADQVPAEQRDETFDPEARYDLIQDANGQNHYVKQAAAEQKLPSDLNSIYKSIVAQWEQSKGSALTPDENKQALAKAGELNLAMREGRLRAENMTQAINSALSGLSVGSGVNLKYPGSSAKATGQPSQPSQPAGPTSAVRQPVTPPAKPATPTQAATSSKRLVVQRPDGQQVSFTPDEMDRIEKLKAQLLKIGPGAGFGQALRVRFMRDLPLLEKATGLSSEQLSATLSYRQDLAKSLTQSVTRYFSLKRLDDTIQNQAAILRRAIDAVDDTGSPAINSLLRGVQSSATGAPSLSQFQIALNAVTRDYAAAQSSGGLSNATIPVSNVEDAKKAFPSGMTPEQGEAILDTIKQEVGASLAAQEGLQRDIYSQIGSPLGVQPGQSGNNDKGMITVEIDGRKGQIPAGNLDAAKKKYPNLKVVQ